MKIGAFRFIKSISVYEFGKISNPLDHCIIEWGWTINEDSLSIAREVVQEACDRLQCKPRELVLASATLR